MPFLVSSALRLADACDVVDAVGSAVRPASEALCRAPILQGGQFL